MNALSWMAQGPVLAALALLGVSALLMVLPFVPAWREWRRPRDAAPLPLSRLVVPPQTDEKVSAVTGALTPASAHRASSEASSRAATPGPFCAQSAQPLHWPAGQAFAQLQAPTVWLGVQGHPRQRPPLETLLPAPGSLDRPDTGSDTGSVARPAGVSITPGMPAPTPPVPGAQPWGGGWRIDGDARVPDGLQLHGPLVVHGALQLGQGCRVAGDVKVHGRVELGPGSCIEGALVGLQDAVLGAGSGVTGPVMVQGHLHLARGARIGQPTRATTASAQWVTAASGSVVHGQLQAREAGVVL